MSEVVGVRFHQASKIYYFNTAGIDLELGDHVVVETSRGLELGNVVVTANQTLSSNMTEPLKPVVRKASNEDIKQEQKNQEKAIEALKLCRESVTKLNLPMKLISANYSLDRNHLTVFFIAEKRVDFRELLKELSRNLKTRVELRQVGARDEARLFGGVGKCGYPLCCTTFLCEFSPVSIRMAKEQEVALNPMKTSGICGRLLCCLGYEFEQYRNMKETLPQVGQEVSTVIGKAKVVSSNPLKQSLSVELHTGAIAELPVTQVTWEKKPPIDEQHQDSK
jgi:cell fate regulator YaaT (PSP1 superfamily)